MQACKTQEYRFKYKLKMTDYRRNRVPGGTFFFTVNLYDRRSRLLVQHIEVLRDAVRQAQRRAPFHIDAWVVLPDHMHCLWTLPEGDIDFSGRWNAIKIKFSRKMPAGEYRSASRALRRERGIWQRRFWEHTIRDERDYAAHLDYVHFNPVKHGLVECVAVRSLGPSGIPEFGVSPLFPALANLTGAIKLYIHFS
jgi:putative transposase